MKLDVTRSDIWVATIEDRPGGLNKKLAALAEAGANLEFIISRRAPEKPGKGVVFLTPLTGAKQVKAATAAGFKKSANMHSLRIQGPDKPGIGTAMTTALAEAGINLRGLSGAVLGRQFVGYLALDTAQDATKAAQILKKLTRVRPSRSATRNGEGRAPGRTAKGFARTTPRSQRLTTLKVR